MNFMFLPVGTVCKLNNVNKKVIIIGYDSKLNYVGAQLPAGLVNGNDRIIFDSSKIVDIFKLGYRDNETDSFSNFLFNKINNSNKDVGNSNDVNTKYEFDKNGFVIGEINGTIKQNQEEKSAPQSTPKYEFDENGFVIREINGPIKQKIEEKSVPQSTPKYKFDENGYVIGEE